MTEGARTSGDAEAAYGRGIGATQVPEPVSPRSRSRAEKWDTGCRSQSETEVPNFHTGARHPWVPPAVCDSSG